MNIDKQTKRINGGYNALKGYVYQFDKVLIDVISKNQTATIEHIEDLEYKDFYVQIKNRDATKFTYSTIKNSVFELITDYSNTQSGKYILYCHFKNKKEEVWVPDLQELDKILSDKKDIFSLETKQEFLKTFKVHFAPNFIKQFSGLIAIIKNTYSFKSDEEAIKHHSILFCQILKIALKKNSLDRKIDKKTIDKLIKESQEVIFFSAYRKYLSNKKYLSFIRNEYFAQKKVNIANLERLFIIDSTTKDCDLIKIITTLGNKYSIPDHSPPPFLCIRNHINLSSLKQKLCDQKLTFFDGTHFDGDKFRLTELIDKSNNHNHKNLIKIKLIKEEKLSNLIRTGIIDEAFVLFTVDPAKLIPKDTKVNQFSVDKAEDVISLFN